MTRREQIEQEARKWIPYDYEFSEGARWADLNPVTFSEMAELAKTYGTMIDDLKAQLTSAEARITELEEMTALQETQLERKSREIGQAEHRGNTVNYIYDKCENYGRQLLECGNKLRAAEAREQKLVEAIKSHHDEWNSYGNCMSECSRLCKALAEHEAAKQSGKEGK